MASPAVTGAAAVYKSLHPGATPAQVRLGLRAAASFDWRTATVSGRRPRSAPRHDLVRRQPGLLAAARGASARAWTGVSGVGINLRIRRGNGYAGPWRWTSRGCPPGVTASWDRDVLPGLADITARVTFSAAADADAWTGDDHPPRQRERPDAHGAGHPQRHRRQDGASVSGPTLSIATSGPSARTSRSTCRSPRAMAARASLGRKPWNASTAALANDLAHRPDGHRGDRRLAFHHAYVHRATVTDRSGNATIRVTDRCSGRVPCRS